jgi:hypothetical protein
MSWIQWAIGVAGAGGAITAAAWLGLLPAFVAAAMALLRGIIDILLDLAQSAAGRYVLLIAIAAICAVYTHYIGYQAGFAAKKPIHSVVTKCPDQLDLFGIFNF